MNMDQREFKWINRQTGTTGTRVGRIDMQQGKQGQPEAGPTQEPRARTAENENCMHRPIPIAACETQQQTCILFSESTFSDTGVSVGIALALVAPVCHLFPLFLGSGSGQPPPPPLRKPPRPRA